MILLFLVGIGLSVTPLSAEPVEGLYQSEQWVAENIVAPDSSLIKSGMAKVLMKVSGFLGAAALVDELASEPVGYLREFRFESTREVRTDEKGNDYLAQRLLLQFDPQAIDNLLLKHSLMPLGKYRPKLLIWLLGDVDNTSFNRYRERILEHASLLAFPADVVLYQDPGAVKRSDRLSDRLRYHSKQYGKSFAIIVSVDSERRFAWRLLTPEESAWQTINERFIDALASVFQLWVVSSGVKVVADDSIYLNTHQITVTSVKNVADYAAIMEYVFSLASISAVEVVSMSHEVLTLSLKSSLKVASLTQLLSLDRRMMLMRPLRDEEGKSLRWRWIGSRER